MMPIFRIVLGFAAVLFPLAAYSQTPNLEPGVSHDLAKWRAAHYSDVRYKLNLTIEKMSPVLKGTIEIRVVVRDAASEPPASAGGPNVGTDAANRSAIPIILDWRKIKGHEKDSTITNVSINGAAAVRGSGVRSSAARSSSFSWLPTGSQSGPAKAGTPNFGEINEHLVFHDGVVLGENVITLDFTSPILTSGSAVTRYIDKEDGSEYIYSLFVPSDASTAFPVFDQPDLKARFQLTVQSIGRPTAAWTAISNTDHGVSVSTTWGIYSEFKETRPISTYVFAFAVGDFVGVGESDYSKILMRTGEERKTYRTLDFQNDGKTATQTVKQIDEGAIIYVRRSQAEKFKPHAAEVFRLNRAAVKFFEEYFDYKFPFPKYDIVLIPELPFGGMEHAGATFLRESSVIFPQEPTKNDEISRATLIFHEAAHQWFGDTVTMRWFDDLWLKEGFANFMAYKALEKIMPEANAWKVFYERVKQAAYRTDSTKGTTPIYQKIDNLSAAKSAYGNIVYNKAPAFLRQAEFYIGEDKFRTAVRAFLKKHEYSNATWEDLVKEFEVASGSRLKSWADVWITQKGVPLYRTTGENFRDFFSVEIEQYPAPAKGEKYWWQKVEVFGKVKLNGSDLSESQNTVLRSPPVGSEFAVLPAFQFWTPDFVFPNYQDYGYGIFLLDEKSREYVLENIQNEKDPFLRSMMWGALWDSVREGELDPKEFVELAVKVLSPGFSRQKITPKGVTLNGEAKEPPKGGTPNSVEDESTTALLLNRVGTALNYYLSEPPASAGGRSGRSSNRPAANAAGSDLRERIEDMLVNGMINAKTQGMRITYYRAFLNVSGSDNARDVLKQMLKLSTTPSAEAASTPPYQGGELKSTPSAEAASTPPYQGGELKSTPSAEARIPLKTKDKFDIVTRLIILGDPEAMKLLDELERAETSDDAKRYAYAARAGIATPENKAKYWNDFINNKEISESWIEAALGPWNSLRQSDLTLPYLERALKELPNHKRSRKIFFVNGWLGAFIGGQRSEEALGIINKFLSDNPKLDNDLRLKILENADTIERAVKIRKKF